MSAQSTDEPQLEVVKWYTRARKFPQLIGRTSDGFKIPGGPYTFTQVGVGVTVLMLGQQTARLWAHFGLMLNVVVLLGVTWAAIALSGRLPIGARNPLSIAEGALQAVMAPRTGKVAGRTVTIRRPHRAGRTRIGTPAQREASTAEPLDRTLPTPAVVSRPVAQLAAPVPAGPELHAPATAPIAAPGAALVPLTGVQRLLAQTTGRNT